MRIDAGLIIGIVLEFVIMLYFSNSTLKPKKNYYISATIAFVGYVILFILSLLNLIAVNIISFVIINFFDFYYWVSDKFKNSNNKGCVANAVYVCGRKCSIIYFEN